MNSFHKVLNTNPVVHLYINKWLRGQYVCIDQMWRELTVALCEDNERLINELKKFMDSKPVRLEFEDFGEDK